MAVLEDKPHSATAVAAHYGALLHGFVLEQGDESTGIAVRVFPAATLMRSLPDKVALAKTVLSAVDTLR